MLSLCFVSLLSSCISNHSYEPVITLWCRCGIGINPSSQNRLSPASLPLSLPPLDLPWLIVMFLTPAPLCTECHLLWCPASSHTLWETASEYRKWWNYMWCTLGSDIFSPTPMYSEPCSTNWALSNRLLSWRLTMLKMQCLSESFRQQRGRHHRAWAWPRQEVRIGLGMETRTGGEALQGQWWQCGGLSHAVVCSFPEAVRAVVPGPAV